MWPSNHPPSASRTSSEAGRFAGIDLKQRFKISNVSCNAVHLQEQSGYLLKGYRFVRIYLESRSILWNWSEGPDVHPISFNQDILLWCYPESIIQLVSYHNTLVEICIIDIYITVSHCATSRKGADSIPDGVVGIFHWLSNYGPEVDSASNRN
jgi:hypothetical protein